LFYRVKQDRRRIKNLTRRFWKRFLETTFCPAQYHASIFGLKKIWLPHISLLVATIENVVKAQAIRIYVRGCLFQIFE